VTDADVGHVVVVRVAYDQPMDIRSTPSVQLGWSGGTLVRTADNVANSYWISDTVYLARFTAVDSNISLNHISLSVTGATDGTGRGQNPYSYADFFSVNTLSTPPSVVSATPNLTLLTDAAAAAAQPALVVSIVFSAPMRMGRTITVGFAAGSEYAADVAGTLSLNAANTGWIDPTHYMAKFDVHDVNVVVPAVTITVTGAEDAGGHVQYRYEGSGFSIDTLTGLEPLAQLRGAVLSSGAMNLSVGGAISSATQQSARNPVDQVLALTGTWLGI
jgi:hypothetical protein